MKNRTTTRQAWDYAKAVVAGDVIACKYLTMACKKLVHEYELLQYDEDYPWVFHDPSAQHLLDFAAQCKYPDGIVARLPIHLHPWQNFVFAMAYGWKQKGNLDTPRFNNIYTRIARKNDKTTGLGVVMLYELLTGPAGHEEYITAVNRDQASIAFRKICQMGDLLGSELKQHYGTFKNPSSNAFIVARSRDNKASDGASCYRGYWDEAARIEDEESFDILHSSQGAWQGKHQNWYLSTAQANRETRYYKDMEVGRRLLEGSDNVPPDFDRNLYIFYELDDELEWDQPDMWIKSNPSLGLSIRQEELEQECFEAKASPSKRSEFLRKKCNIYVAAENPWLDVNLWNSLKVDTLSRTGNCYIGLDMGKTSDLNGITAVWTNRELQRVEVENWAFLPKAAIEKAPKHTVNVYREAIDRGSLIITEGSSIDEDTIEKFIRELCSKYRVIEVAFDPYKSQAMMTRLEADGLPMVQHRQGRISMSPAIGETEKYIKSDTGLISHLGDPFMAWQIGNAQVKIDQNDLQSLEKPTDYAMKIDNVIALVMAIGRATVHGGLTPPRNYNIRTI